MLRFTVLQCVFDKSATLDVMTWRMRRCSVVNASARPVERENADQAVTLRAEPRVPSGAPIVWPRVVCKPVSTAGLPLMIGLQFRATHPQSPVPMGMREEREGSFRR